MRYLFILLLCIGCGDCSNAQSSKKVAPAYKPRFSRIAEFKYKEHDYLYFQKGLLDDGFSCVHDPDCKKCKGE